MAACEQLSKMGSTRMERLTGTQRWTLALVAVLFVLLSCVLLFALTTLGTMSTDPWALAGFLLGMSLLTLVVAAVFMRDAGLLHRRLYTLIIITGALSGSIVLIVGLVNTWDWFRVGSLLVGGVILVRSLLTEF